VRGSCGMGRHRSKTTGDKTAGATKPKQPAAKTAGAPSLADFRCMSTDSHSAARRYVVRFFAEEEL
jgi:hypothetical protein